MALRLVIADDDPAVCRSLELAAADLLPEFQVVSATTILQARSLLGGACSMRDRLVVLSDFDFRDGQTGIEILEHARATHPSSVRFLMTGQDLDTLPRLAKAPFDRIVPKPFRMEDLAAAIRVRVRDL